jgi:hypothetical protein
MMYFQPYLANEAKTVTPPPTPIVFEPAAPARWEYHVVALDPREDEPLDEQSLTALGGEGWLLANVLTIPGGQTISRIYYYFVRQAE